MSSSSSACSRLDVLVAETGDDGAGGSALSLVGDSTRSRMVYESMKVAKLPLLATLLLVGLSGEREGTAGGDIGSGEVGAVE